MSSTSGVQFKSTIVAWYKDDKPDDILFRFLMYMFCWYIFSWVITLSAYAKYSFYKNLESSSQEKSL